MNILRRVNVANKQVETRLESLNEMADPGTEWVVGKVLEQGKTPLWLVEVRAAKKATAKKAATKNE